MMTTVGSYEAKTHLPELLERVAQGEKILITRRGVPVAFLSPPPQHNEQDVRRIIAEFKAYSKRRKRTLGGLTMRQMIEEGRRF